MTTPPTPSTPTTFADLGVSEPVVAALAERGITDAFPIQSATAEASLDGRDICGKAPTGSGKTIAFGIPAVELSSKGSPWRPSVLILSPTRELASQIKEELAPLAKACKRSILTVFGGTNIQTDIRQLEKGIDILVACPGRLEDLISRRCCELRDAQLVIVDEADRMADMGFLPSVKRILDQTPDDRHTLLFSATLDGDVDMLIKRYQRDPLTFEVEEHIGEIGDVEHSWYLIQPANRIDSAVNILQRYYSSIVFCRTRRGCDRVAKMFKKKGLPAVAIHGDRSQKQRERALADFTNGKAQVLVATDVAARGIHVDNVSLVMHYDPAGSDKDYIHRSGRTGRAGQDGRVISMVVEDKKKIARQLQKDLGMKPGFDDLDMSSFAAVIDRPAYVEEPQPAKQKQGGSKRGSERDGSGRGGTRRDGGKSRQGRDPRDNRGPGKKRGKQGSSQNRDKRRNDRWDDDDRRDGSKRQDGRGRGKTRNDRGSGKNRNRDDDRDNSRSSSRGGGRRRPPRPRAGSGKDWYPPEYYKNDREERDSRDDSNRGKNRSNPGRKKGGKQGDKQGGKPSRRENETEERTVGGSGSTKRKSRSVKGRHADKGANKGKGKRRR